MSKSRNSSVVFNSISSEPTTQTGLVYMDDGTNTGGQENIMRIYDGTTYQNIQKIPEVTVLSEQQTLGTNGGGFTASTDTTRTLNTVSVSRDWLSLSSNVFTIDGATYPGNYLIEWSTPAFEVDNFVSWLENNGTSATVRVGSSAYSSTDTVTYSYGFYYASITSSIALKIVARCATTKATNGLGVTKGGTLQQNDVFTVVKITRY